MDSPPTQSYSAFGNCPKCLGLVRIPIDIKPTSQISCPMCQSIFLVHQLNDLTLPQATVIQELPNTKAAIPQVDRPLFTEEGAGRKKFVVPPQLAKGAKRKRGRSRSKSKSGSGSNRAGDNANPFENTPSGDMPVFRKRERSIPLADDVSDLLGEEEDIEIEDLSLIRNHDTPSQPIRIRPIGDDRETDSAIQAQDDSLNLGRGEGEESAFTISTDSNPTGSRPAQRGVRPKRMVAPHASLRRVRSEPARPTSPTIEMIKIVLGAVTAFPVAYMILMWIFLQDPLDLGPILGRNVPALVPRVFREKPTRLPITLVDENGEIKSELDETEGSQPAKQQGLDAGTSNLFGVDQADPAMILEGADGG